MIYPYSTSNGCHAADLPTVKEALKDVGFSKLIANLFFDKIASPDAQTALLVENTTGMNLPQTELAHRAIVEMLLAQPDLPEPLIQLLTKLKESLEWASVHILKVRTLNEAIQNLTNKVGGLNQGDFFPYLYLLKDHFIYFVFYKTGPDSYCVLEFSSGDGIDKFPGYDKTSSKTVTEASREHVSQLSLFQKDFFVDFCFFMLEKNATLEKVHAFLLKRLGPIDQKTSLDPQSLQSIQLKGTCNVKTFKALLRGLILRFCPNGYELYKKHFGKIFPRQFLSIAEKPEFSRLLREDKDAQKLFQLASDHFAARSVLPPQQNIYKKYLDYSDGSFKKDEELTLEASKKSTRLNWLTLKNRPVTDHAFHSIHTWGKYLTWIDLSNCKEITDAALQQIASTCHDLMAIDLSGTNVTDEGIRTLCQGCPVLVKLKVSNCSQLTDKMLDAIQLPYLQKFDFSDCQKITSSAKDRFYVKYPSLNPNAVTEDSSDEDESDSDFSDEE